MKGTHYNRYQRLHHSDTSEATIFHILRSFYLFELHYYPAMSFACAHSHVSDFNRSGVRAQRCRALRLRHNKCYEVANSLRLQDSVHLLRSVLKHDFPPFTFTALQNGKRGWIPSNRSRTCPYQRIISITALYERQVF